MALASYASHVTDSRGRRFEEQGSTHRSEFQRDRDRIIHASAFRRLKHKTQVFVEHEGDYYRTRLTHTIEVAQVARTIARTLRLNEDLAEAVALAHDLGHTPFGHTGEDALSAVMKPWGGFDHNAQAIKIVTSLERHYAEFDGLNLTWETLEGIAKHNGPVTGNVPYALSDYVGEHDLELHTHASAEAQVAALSDDIAYNNHDLMDGLRAGLFSEEAIRELPIIRDCYNQVDQLYPDIAPERRRHEALRRVFGVMVEDVLRESAQILERAAPQTVTDIRELDVAMIRFSRPLEEKLNVIRKFFFDNMYRHWQVRRMRRKAGIVVRELFDVFMEDTGLLPDEWRSEANFAGEGEGCARVIADYIAGMTDRFALQEHAKIMDPSRKS